MVSPLEKVGDIKKGLTTGVESWNDEVVCEYREGTLTPPFLTFDPPVRASSWLNPIYGIRKTLKREPEEFRFPGQIGQRITAEERQGECMGKWAAQNLGLSKFSLESNSHSLKMGKSRLGEVRDLPWSHREFVARLSPDLRSPRPLLSVTRQSPWLQHCLLCSLLKCLCTKNNLKPF